VNRLAPIAGGLAAGLALLLAGCGGNGVHTDGPFGNSNVPGDGGECVAVPPGSVGTIGATEFPNPGGPARIGKVTLVGAHDLLLVAAWVVPVTGNDLMGVFPGYPPPGPEAHGLKLSPGVHWAQRQPADGAKIPHTPGHEVINLVLVIKASGAKGTSKTVYIDYKSGGTNYRLDLHFSMSVVSGSPNGC
jgi:hypothetical protein